MKSRSRIVGLLVTLLVAVGAGAAVKNNNIRITVLDAETHSVSVGDNGVPKNCDAVNFDAYCHNSKTVEITNTLLVQEGNDTPYRITCTVDTKWSRCVPLQKGSTFEARREKRGLLVYFVDGSGKVRKQLYALAAPEAGNDLAHSRAPEAVRPNPDAGQSGQRASSESVQCSFTSAPTGAEVSVDGRFVGSTPSVLRLSVGSHAVEISLPGFAQWKRDLEVSKGSELTVNAVLEKAQ